jgi:hypothetical protein
MLIGRLKLESLSHTPRALKKRPELHDATAKMELGFEQKISQ